MGRPNPDQTVLLTGLGRREMAALLAALAEAPADPLRRALERELASPEPEPRPR